MSKFIDLSGQQFGYLTVLYRNPENPENSKRQRTKWICKCICGNVKSYDASNLKRKNTLSCGCMKNTVKHKTHGMSNTKIYKLWVSMKRRCYNPNMPHYEYYGGKGIRVCDEWKENFQSFYEWSIKNGYKDGLSIDRIDNSKDYSPENCRWVTLEEQAKNKTNLLYATVNGETKSLCEWSEISGVPLNALRLRYLRDTAKGKIHFDESFLSPLREWPRKVEQYTLSGKLIKIWDSAKQADEAGFGAEGSIRECCSGKNSQHLGYRWKYAN